MTNDEYEKSKTAKDPAVVQSVISYLCREMVKKDKEIAELKSDLELFMDLCDKKDEWLEVQRNEIADLKIALDGWRNKSF